MWNRKELKAKGKAAFKRNYWNCVLVALIVLLITAAISGRPAGQQPDNGETSDQPMNLSVHISAGAVGLSSLLHLLVLNPVEVGSNKFFADNARGNAPLNDVLGGFTGNYMRNVLALLLRNIFIALWTLLLIIPGIVKAYSYRMVPYILADNTEIGPKEAIDLSRQMMKGNKWKSFMLDLSFIGWYILCVLTLGIVAIFHVGPYVSATEAELYLALRENV